jgi:hypothetical protein
VTEKDAGSMSDSDKLRRVLYILRDVKRGHRRFSLDDYRFRIDECLRLLDPNWLCTQNQSIPEWDGVETNYEHKNSHSRR